MGVQTGQSYVAGAGGMAERTNARLLKSREVRASVGSNPTPSACCHYHNIAPGNRCNGLSVWATREWALFKP